MYLPHGPAVPLVGISPKRDVYSMLTAAQSRGAPPYQQVMKKQNVEDRYAKGGKA